MVYKRKGYRGRYLELLQQEPGLNQVQLFQRLGCNVSNLHKWRISESFSKVEKEILESRGESIQRLEEVRKEAKLPKTEKKSLDIPGKYREFLKACRTIDGRVDAAASVDLEWHEIEDELRRNPEFAQAYERELDRRRVIVKDSLFGTAKSDRAAAKAWLDMEEPEIDGAARKKAKETATKGRLEEAAGAWFDKIQTSEVPN